MKTCPTSAGFSPWVRACLNQALPLSNSLVGVSLPLGECMVCRLADERHGILSNTLGCILKEVGDLCI